MIAGGEDDDASVSSNDSSTLGVVHRSEGDMWANHPSVIINPVQEEQAPNQIPVPPFSCAPDIVENNGMGPTLPTEGARSSGSGGPSLVGSPVKQCPRSFCHREYDNPKWEPDEEGCLQQKEMHNFAKMKRSELNKTKAKHVLIRQAHALHIIVWKEASKSLLNIKKEIEVQAAYEIEAREVQLCSS